MHEAKATMDVRITDDRESTKLTNWEGGYILTVCNRLVVNDLVCKF